MSTGYIESSFAHPPRAVRIIDIAEEVGVSSRVVSKVLFPYGSNNARVGKDTARRVEEVAQRLGYKPNLTAQQLAGASSRMFGVLIDSFTANVTHSVLTHLEQLAAARNHRLVVGQLHGDMQMVDKFIEDFSGRGMDGVISFIHEDPKAKEMLHGARSMIPNTVYIGPPAPSGADWVSADLAEGVKLIVRHLHQIGKKRIVLLQPQSGLAPYAERIRGFKSAIGELNMRECFPWFFKVMDGIQSHGPDIYRALDRLRSEGKQFDAIIAANDLMALYVIQYLNGLGVIVPQDVAVAGFDNSEMATAAIPGVTSVDQRPFDIAASALEMLLSRKLRGDIGFRSIFVSPRLVVRDSTERGAASKLFGSLNC